MPGQASDSNACSKQKKSEWGVYQKANVGRKDQYLNWNSMVDCCPLLSTGVSEQWASPGPQAREEGTEGQFDPGSPPGVVLQHLATLFHHQHGAGKRSDLNMKIKTSAESVRLFFVVYFFPPFILLCSVTCLWLTSRPFFLHVSVRRVLKQCEIYAKEHKKNNTWIQVYFCVDQLSRHSSCKAIQRGNGLAFQLCVADSLQSFECTNTI